MVRHGRTVRNAEQRFQGHADAGLDATGLQQASRLGDLFGAEDFGALISSDLARARTTAEAIARGRPVELDPRWRELQFGEWEGLTWPEIAARFPEAGGRPNSVPQFITPAGGESFAQLSERVGGALADLRSRFPAGGRALIVTHAGPLHALLHVLLGETEARTLAVRFVPASYTRFELGADGVRLLELNRAAGESDGA